MSSPLTRREKRALRPTTQQRQPWRATARTALAALLGIASATPAVVSILGEELNGWELLGLGGQAVAVASIITRFMAHPKVDALLEHVGLGSAPEAAA